MLKYISYFFGEKNINTSIFYNKNFHFISIINHICHNVQFFYLNHCDKYDTQPSVINRGKTYIYGLIYVLRPLKVYRTGAESLWWNEIRMPA